MARETTATVRSNTSSDYEKADSDLIDYDDHGKPCPYGNLGWKWFGAPLVHSCAVSRSAPLTSGQCRFQERMAASQGLAVSFGKLEPAQVVVLLACYLVG